jgi:catechol 2,3-dioxygenase-like lactoylglutathione lyase family enzyme
MTSVQPLFASFAFIPMRVRDLEETIRFYTEDLGFYLLRKYRFVPDGLPMAYVGLNDILLELFQVDEGAALERVSFGLTVSDLDAAIVHLRGRGHEIVRENFSPRSFWGRQAGIDDPSGHGISLREWHAPDGPTYPDWHPRYEGGERLA